MDLVRSPKLNPVGPRWYRYYAGFAPEFVSDICDVFSVEDGSHALDPWMGSGTTLSVAATRGATVAGVDLNPAMLAVAKGRLLAMDTLSSLDPLGVDISRAWEAERASLEKEPLRHWFDDETAQLLRGLSSRILRVLADEDDVLPYRVENVSSLTCFYLVALFDTVTTAVRSYGSRNPTWIKRSEDYDGTVALSIAQIRDSFIASVKRLSAYLRNSRSISTEVHDNAVISRADSRSLPFSNATFDAIITSPPYLTRLDYVMGHAPELAVLGYDGTDIRNLRDSMIGTPTRKNDEASALKLGSVTDELLASVRDHDSYAARSYYEPNFRQYFVGMAASFAEIQRVSKPGASVVLVVQDSRFKDIHIDLAGALTDMGRAMGWEPGPRKDFVNVRSMAQLNKKAHYVARTTKPTESVISFTLPTLTNQVPE